MLLVRPAGSEDLKACEEHMRRVLAEDLGGYRQRWHADVDDLAGTYLDRPGWALFLAELDGVFAGTASIRPGGPTRPAWLAERYACRNACQLGRVWTVRELRRCGAGGALVAAAARWALGAGGYAVVYLHTDARAPGALGFWRAHPAAELVHDARPDPWNTVHFELDPARLAEC